jgi:hypothetical protein
MPWWNSEVSKSLAASWEHSISHFGQSEANRISNMIFLCELTIVIHRLPCLIRMAKAVSSTIELYNPVTSDSVDWFDLGMWAFARKCYPIELIPCSDGCRRTWWQTMNMMQGLQVSSIPQCKLNHHEGACLESFQAIGSFDLTFIEPHQESKRTWNVRSLKSQILTRSFLEESLTSSNEVFQDCVSEMQAPFRNLVILTRESAENYHTVKQNAGS